MFTKIIAKIKIFIYILYHLCRYGYDDTEELINELIRHLEDHNKAETFWKEYREGQNDNRSI